jgi:hypothetical protein
MNKLLIILLLIILILFLLNMIKPLDHYTNSFVRIGLIIPVTSNKRNYNNIQDIDFFKILLNSFLKHYNKSNKYYYTFYLGYDDDDLFFIKNNNKIKKYFKEITPNNFDIKLIKINNLKSKLGEIWSKLALEAKNNNDTYLYQLGDDIKFLSNNWEKSFINKLKEFDNIGVVGPLDKNNSKLLTQSFVHIKHLEIFGSYYPKSIKNWFIDDWITDLYKPNRYYMFKNITVINSGGPPRYDIKHENRANINLIVEKDKLRLNTYIKNNK